MLNTAGERELAYVVKIDSIEPIIGSDNCEAAVVGGWRVMTRKGTFQPGSLAIYFEIDSQVDLSKPEFAFMSKYKGHVKTQKYRFGGIESWVLSTKAVLLRLDMTLILAFMSKYKGHVKTQKYRFGGKNPGFYSQGLLMSAEDFGGISYQDGDGQYYLHFGKDSYFKENIDFRVGDFLTNRLNVTYYVVEDNKRKANVNPDARINAALGRHPKIAKKWGRFIKKHHWAKSLFLLFFGKSKKKAAWPVGIPRSDEERIQNMIWALQDKTPLIATEKIDGSSSTFYLTRKGEYKVCSRNVVFDTPKKTCYYDTEDGPGNIYLEMDQKYKMRERLKKILDMFPEAKWVGLQAEIFGDRVQKRNYGRKDRDLRAFSLYLSHRGRIGTVEMKEILDQVEIPTVPILDTAYVLPDTIEELIQYVQSQKSIEDGGLREGIVFRAQDGGLSFKCVDPEFLLKYHG